MQILSNTEPVDPIMSIFRKSLEEEASEILSRSKKLDEKEINSAVNIISNCSGKILTSGVGKCLYVADKMAATFASTGTVSFLLNPLNAGHGDFGNVTEGDAAILISKSGTTHEMVLMCQRLKSRKIPVIAIVGDKNSLLARYADVVIDVEVSKETCPFNKAPTTSATMAMVFGNALAVAVMKAKGITIEFFANNHPDGTLGEILQLEIPKRTA
ncbi:hypothetical protein BV378_12170 [Nostoc sp. RF31YmG]|nr:hypothetical protein BV378_12170 [Nostoc sp. RF31YmG]